MPRLPDDLRHAFRALRTSRGFTTTVVTILALAVALQTSALSLVNAFLVRSLPYPDARRLHSIAYAPPNTRHPDGLETLDWASLDDVVDHRIAWDLDMFYLTGGEHPESAAGAWVTPGYMRGFGVRPALGRAFGPDEFQPGGPQVALISHALWQDRFGGDSAILGRTFTAYVSDRPDDPELFTIIGVLPVDFWHVNPFTQVLTPLRATSYPYYVTLRADVPVEIVRDRIAVLVGGLGTLAPDWRIELRAVHAEYVARVRPALAAITVTVSLVLLIACANVMVLALIRGMRRAKEMTVRLALGASRARVVRLVLAEHLLLAMAGVGAGLVLTTQFLPRLAPTIERQLGRRIPGGPSALILDGTGLAVASLLVVIITALLAAGPLLATARSGGFSLLRRTGRTGADTARSRWAQRVLIAAEVAGSLALVTGAGLMMRSVTRLIDVDLGLAPAGVVTANLALRERDYDGPAAIAALQRRLTDALTATPGVAGAALGSPGPLIEVMPRVIQGDGGGTTGRTASIQAVTADYFEVLRVPLVEGRAFTPQDDLGGEPVAILSETAARQLWPNGQAVGRTVRIGDPAGDGGPPGHTSRCHRRPRDSHAYCFACPANPTSGSGPRAPSCAISTPVPRSARRDNSMRSWRTEWRDRVSWPRSSRRSASLPPRWRCSGCMA